MTKISINKAYNTLAEVLKRLQDIVEIKLYEPYSTCEPEFGPASREVSDQGCACLSSYLNLQATFLQWPPSRMRRVVVRSARLLSTRMMPVCPIHFLSGESSKNVQSEFYNSSKALKQIIIDKGFSPKNYYTLVKHFTSNYSMCQK